MNVYYLYSKNILVLGRCPSKISGTNTQKVCTRQTNGEMNAASCKQRRGVIQMSYTVIQMSYTENDIIWYDHIIVTEEINFLLHPKTFGWGIFGCIFSPCRRIKWIFRNCKMNFQSQTITSRVTWARHFENACFETTVQHETLFISMCIFCLQIYIYIMRNWYCICALKFQTAMLSVGILSHQVYKRYLW